MRWLWILLLCTSTSCGYRFCGKEYATISIPFILGDNKGIFTKELIHAVSTETPLTLSNDSDELLLNVKILSQNLDNVGFRYAKKGSSILVPHEARIELGVCFSLIDLKKGCTILGPQEVWESLLFDFESDFSTIEEHRLSLGQLEMHPLAYEIALKRIGAILSQKIVDILLFYL